MDRDYYAVALKAGQKQYKESVAKGESPYLPVLDDRLTVDRQSLGTDLGLVQIPAEFIIGTKTAGRTHSFAVNFMPLVEENSEFASKWKNLCNSHLEEGIRDPIKAYEYRNRFYVAEGNKRVSVLKFFDAVSIPGHVTRILPERDGSDEIELYYEFMEFYQITKVNFLEFSRRGSYEQLLRLLGRETKEEWDEETVRKLRTSYYYFKKAFLDLGGNKIDIRPADAMLRYIDIHGADSLRARSETEIREMLSKTWQEFALLEEEKPIDIIEDPNSQSSPGILSRIVPAAMSLLKPVVRVLFLYGRAPEYSNWVTGHEKGRLEAHRRLPNQFESITVICSTPEEAEAKMRQAIRHGVTVIFATAAEMMQVCLKVAIDHPQVIILNCSLNVSHRYIRTYYPRMYEAKFISGAIAGAMCRNDRIGYINDYPLFGNIAEINAFSRGVALTNPHAKVYLEWADETNLNEKAMELLDKEITLISVRNRSRSGERDRDLFGLQYVQGGKITELVSPVWNWGAYYEQILRSILDGSFRGQEGKTHKSLNYFWGMSSGVVEIEFSEFLPSGTRYMGELIQKAIRMGVCRPFYEPRTNEAGDVEWQNVRTTISMEEIINMDVLEPNVVGSIPKYDELTEKAKKLVDVIGVKPAKKES